MERYTEHQESGDNKTEHEQLCVLYERIVAEGGMVKEGLAPKGYIAAVGDVEDFKVALGLDPTGDEKITDEMLATMPVFLLFAYPGTGDTRVAAVQDAMEQWQESKQHTKEDEQKLQYGTFSIGGGQMNAYLPGTDEMPHQWTVEYVREGVVEFRENIPLEYPCLFGPDVADVDTLNQSIEILIKQHELEV